MGVNDPQFFYLFYLTFALIVNKKASNGSQCDMLQGQHWHNGHVALVKNSQQTLS